MEDTKSLVTIFLQKIFHDRQYIIDDTYKLIYDYNNGDRRKADYEKTLRSICNQLGKEIPNQVLVYLLTLVDMPLDLAESDDTQLKPVIEKIKTLEEIQKTQTCLTDTIRPHLVDCVSNKSNEKVEGKIANRVETHDKDKQEVKEPEVRKSNAEVKHVERKEESLKSIKPEERIVSKVSRNKRKLVEKLDEGRPTKSPSVQSLLDITAGFVIKNQNRLKRNYQKKFEKAWKLINSNQLCKKSLESCYETLRDLNKKRKLMREIENDNITDELMAELYQDTDIFLKEKHMYDAVNMDIFEYVKKYFIVG